MLKNINALLKLMTRVVAGTATFIVLAGCGGGGSGGDKSPPENPPSQQMNWDSKNWDDGNWA